MMQPAISKEDELQAALANIRFRIARIEAWIKAQGGPGL
jgi:hypothetical protein